MNKITKVLSDVVGISLGSLVLAFMFKTILPFYAGLTLSLIILITNMFFIEHKEEID